MRRASRQGRAAAHTAGHGAAGAALMRYAKLLAEGRRRGSGNLRMYERWKKEPGVKAKVLAEESGVTIHAARAALRRYRAGRAPQFLSAGLEPKTVVNAHRMLHRAWEDFVSWKWLTAT